MSALLEGPRASRDEVDRLRLEVQALLAELQRPVPADDEARRLGEELDRVKARARALDAQRTELVDRRTALRAAFDGLSRGWHGQRPLARAAGFVVGVLGGAVGALLLLGQAAVVELPLDTVEARAAAGGGLLAASTLLAALGVRAFRRAARGPR